jgi:hypothetical protein
MTEPDGPHSVGAELGDSEAPNDSDPKSKAPF